MTDEEIKHAQALIHAVVQSHGSSKFGDPRYSCRINSDILKALVTYLGQSLKAAEEAEASLRIICDLIPDEPGEAVVKVMRLKQAYQSLIPSAFVQAIDDACTKAERDSAVAENTKFRALLTVACAHLQGVEQNKLTTQEWREWAKQCAQVAERIQEETKCSKT